MSEATVRRIQQWLRDHEDELLADYRAMLRIPSLEGPPEPNAPFGLENRRALDFALELSRKFGMRAVDLDGYIGYAEIGQGPLVMTVGHLDVVPVGPRWKHEPFGAEIDGGYVYARGATDDKGPTMASFYAVRAINECVPELKARLRQAFGCNEESGFGCVHHYMKVDEAPVLGIAPDSMWPLVNAEKGIANILVGVPLHKGDFELVEVRGGQRPNIVIDSCEATVLVSDAVRSEVEGKLEDSWDRNLTFSWEGPYLKVSAIGKAAHGSTPFYGDSAATRVFRFLLFLAPIQDDKFYEELFLSTHISGSGLGILGRDALSEDLTNNLGVVSTNEDNVELLFNVRYPVSWNGDALRERCESHLAKLKSGWRVERFTDSPPLHFPLDHPLVKTLCEVHEAETGERKEPGVMGGGTYARAIPNTVSVGTCWDGDGHAHETDERLKIEHLYKASRIYAHMLYRLCQMAAGQQI